MENNAYNEINNPYGFIYITTNIINGKKYLGKRKFSHGWTTYLGSGTIFHKAIELYGKENFSRNIVCFCYSEEELNKAEYDWSVFLNVVESPDWYNVVYGGGSIRGYHLTEEQKQWLREINLGKRHSEDTKQKLRIMFSGESAPWYGKHLPEDVRNKISQAAKRRVKEKNAFYGKHHTEESKRKMSESKKGKSGKPTSEKTKEKLRIANTGKKHSDATKRKLSEAHKGRTAHNKGKCPSEETKKKLSEANNANKKIVICVDTGITYSSLHEAERQTGISRNGIARVCNHKAKTAGGFTWMYIQ
jgi:group I intron endonuclease